MYLINQKNIPEEVTPKLIEEVRSLLLKLPQDDITKKVLNNIENLSFLELTFLLQTLKSNALLN